MTSKQFQDKHGEAPPRLLAARLDEYRSKTRFASERDEQYTEDVVAFYDAGGYDGERQREMSINGIRGELANLSDAALAVLVDEAKRESTPYHITLPRRRALADRYGQQFIDVYVNEEVVRRWRKGVAMKKRMARSERDYK